MTCAETSGFLFRHDCGRDAQAQCQLCGKPICAMHTRAAEAQIFCITCLKKWLEGRPAEQQQAAQQAAQQPLEQQRRVYYGSPWYTYDDPYWYTSRHYPTYHEHDFTAQDRKAFQATPAEAGTAGPAEAFETDKEAS